MHYLTIAILKSLRKALSFFRNSDHTDLMSKNNNPEECNYTITDYLTNDKPCMIARFGAFELSTIQNYLGAQKKPSIFKYILGKQSQWWWNHNLLNHMQNNAGFFPATEDNAARFAKLMLEDSHEIDILGSWLSGERDLITYMNPKVVRLRLLLLEPFWTNTPWTSTLKGKKVLVIHPFAKQISRQYIENRTKLFANQNVLPEFELYTIPAIQSIGGECGMYKDWFEALEWMKSEMDKTDYDIVLIGCGAYGFCLAAHAKRTGHKAVHLGGSLQLLFGIKGRRWENPDYGEQTFGRKGTYLELFNEYWQYPDDEYVIKDAQNVENACYWK